MRPARLAPPGGGHDGYRHEAVLHDGIDALVEVIVPWVEDGLVDGEPVVMMLTGHTAAAVRAGLGPRADRVHFGDMGEAGRNPARIISVWRDLHAGHARPGRKVRAVGEPVWPGRSPAEMAECVRHEALLNAAFADAADLWLLCPYDTARLDAAVIEEAERTHPHLVRDGSHRPSARYDERAVLGAALDGPLPPPDGPVSELVIDGPSLRGLRHVVACHAEAAGIAPGRAANLVLAVSEAATNSIVHGGGSGLLRSWRAADDTLVHEVSDRGRIEDPLVGRARPGRGSVGGRGLWLVHEMCDLVQVRSGPAGTVVRLIMRCH